MCLYTIRLINVGFRGVTSLIYHGVLISSLENKMKINLNWSIDVQNQGMLYVGFKFMENNFN